MHSLAGLLIPILRSKLIKEGDSWKLEMQLVGYIEEARVVDEVVRSADVTHRCLQISYHLLYFLPPGRLLLSS